MRIRGEVADDLKDFDLFFNAHPPCAFEGVCEHATQHVCGFDYCHPLTWCVRNYNVVIAGAATTFGVLVTMNPPMSKLKMNMGRAK